MATNRRSVDQSCYRRTYSHRQDSSTALPLQHKILAEVVESPLHKKVHDRERTGRPLRPPQHQRELPICRSSLQPQSLSGKKLDPNDIPILDGSQQPDVAMCSCNAPPRTTVTSTDTRMPSVTSNNALEDEQKPSENMPPPMEQTRLLGALQPHVLGRSHGIAGDSKMSLQTPNRYQLSPDWYERRGSIYQEHARSRSR